MPSERLAYLLASQAQTKSCREWYSVIGNTNNPRAGPGIRAFAIGMPLMTDFCDPQNTIAVSSAGSNRITRLPLIIISRAAAKSTASISASVAKVATGTRCQRPATTDALKAA